MYSIFSYAIANSGVSTQNNNPYSIVVMLVIFAAIFYFIIFRPQQKRNKAHKELMNSISVGDEVLTVGGLIGKIVRVIESGYVVVNLNDKSSEVIVKRDCITSILPKGTIQSL